MSRRGGIEPTVKLWGLLLLLTATTGFAEPRHTFPITELSADGIYATRADDPTVYCLLGANACLFSAEHNPWTEDALIQLWLKGHPRATALPVSEHNWLIGAKPQPTVYLWIEDGLESLNVALVREGHYGAGHMIDRVDADRLQAEWYKDPQIEKERAETPEPNRPHRLVSDAVYTQMMQRVTLAEKEAQEGKKGIWADAGMKGRSPPRDQYLILQYKNHPQWFARIKTLISEDGRLAELNRDPDTWADARSAGVTAERIHEYVDLLEKLDANEQLKSVYGLGKQCLIVADIVYGFFDNGVIKGYVLAPSEPRPLVVNLDDWQSDEKESTAYRLIDSDWYLFVVYH